MKGFKSLMTLGLALACAAITFSLAVCAQAQTYTDLANFDGKNGVGFNVPLIQATDGNFYGASPADTFGNVFRVTPSGNITAIYKFCSQPHCADGDDPFWGPVLGSDGNLYGVAQTGGSHAGSKYGSGTFYRMTLSGEITILYTFCSATPCTDGQYPNGITLARDGNFYGTAYLGGQFNKGEIFEISPTGKLKVLYSFCSLANCGDGFEPSSPPIQASNGSIYGVTMGGAGAVYKLTPSGNYTVLHHFCSMSGCKDGFDTTTLVEGADGNIFGTTVEGGSHNYGTVFEVTSTDQYLVLDSFDYLRSYPFEGLALANDGNLYGVTDGPGGAENGGTIYEVTPTGRYTLLYTFNECSISGYNPEASLFQGTDGLLYGSTLYGGIGDDGNCGGSGTIFTLANGLRPLVETVPQGGRVGNSVIILGNGLTGSTSVTFNGVEAEFTVESDTYIKATVPKGATTGIVSAVTPSGTLDSNPQFVVTK